MKRNTVTLNDVAREADVSPATVSRVLNGNIRIGDATRNRVMAAAEKLGYDTAGITDKAEALARASRSRNCRLELLLCPLNEQKDMLHLDFYSRILEGIQSVLPATGGAELSVLTLGRTPEINRAVKERLLAADGILLLGQQGVNECFFDEILDRNIPVVAIGRCCGDPRINSVEHDDLESSLRMAEILTERGFRSAGAIRIGSSSAFERRLMGLMLALRRNSGAVRELETRSAVSSDDRDIRQAFLGWMAEGDLPECMIASHLNAAVVISDCLKEKGLRCPDDLSILTFDATGELVRGTDVVFSGFRTVPETMGRKAALRILELLERGADSDSAHRILIPLPFVPGNSVADKTQAAFNHKGTRK
ncbi:MAG: LacI family DNA-binding transcriptional regulator [Lentisphaeria bacterium]|nr:LacI family DNA-binding transcriptional regulator [Lentisphaeria bacterium]